MIRFYNGKVLRIVNAAAQLTEDEVWVDGSRICYVGPKKDNMPAFERQIDLDGDVLMPGFKNAHTHTAMTFLRSYADDMPLNDWLFKQVFPMEAKLNSQHIYDFTKLGILEYLSSGITASFDMYYRNDDYVQANIDCGFRTVICSALNNFDADPSNIEREYLKFNNIHENISYMLGMHAEYTSGIERMEYMKSLLDKYKTPFFIHCSETKAEVDGCIERHGMTPPQLLDKLGLFDYGGGGYHCVWMSDEDIALFAKKKLWAVTNPCSNLKLASGIAQVDKMLAAGVPMAIGTDGAASNNALDFFREMYLVSVLQKVQNMDAAAGGADKVLEMACVGGARAMGLNHCDDIAEGKFADMVVIDLKRPNMRPLNNIAKNIVYSGSKENVRLTMVAGKVLYENGRFFIDEDAEEIYARCEKHMQELTK